MKKLLVVLVIMAALVLTGCEDASAKVKSETLVSFGKVKVTKQELYESLRDNDSGSTALTLLKYRVGDLEVETTDEITTDAQETVDSTKSMYGDQFEDYLDYIGCATEEEYLEQCVSAAKYNKLTDLYIAEQWDQLVEEYYPKQVKMLEVKDAQTANDIYAELKDSADKETDFEALAKKHSTNSSDYYKGNVITVSSNDSSSLNTYINSFLKTAAKGELSTIMTNTTADAYYLVYVVETDTMSFKSDAVDAVKKSSTIETEMMSYYLKKYEFKVYDITFYNYLKSNYPTYLNQ